MRHQLWKLQLELTAGQDEVNRLRAELEKAGGCFFTFAATQTLARNLFKREIFFELRLLILSSKRTACAVRLRSPSVVPINGTFALSPRLFYALSRISSVISVFCFLQSIAGKIPGSHRQIMFY
ncbi:MAG: hypothetical protein RLZZ536_2621 [Planctomycetota bacterium]|jgi:hypothetical protein